MTGIRRLPSMEQTPRKRLKSTESSIRKSVYPGKQKRNGWRFLQLNLLCKNFSSRSFENDLVEAEIAESQVEDKGGSTEYTFTMSDAYAERIKTRSEGAPAEY